MKKYFCALIALLTLCSAGSTEDAEVPAPAAVNTALSPVSLELALLLAGIGADGEAADALASFLGSELTAEELLRRTERLNAAGVHSANAAFVREGLGLGEDYREDVESAGCRVFQGLDAGFVNAWVREQTMGMIPELLREPPALDLMLVNALALDARWRYPFLPGSSADAVFYAPGGEVTATYMNATHAFAHGERDGVQFARLDYAGEAEDLSLYLAMPQDMNAALEALREQGLDWFATEDDGMLRIALPKFRVECTLDLTGALSAGELAPLFRAEGGAFDRIFPGAYVSQVLQSVSVTVDEEGTHAAAATAIGMYASGAPGAQIDEITFDHPFLAVVGNRETGDMLFVAVINNPAAEDIDE